MQDGAMTSDDRFWPLLDPEVHLDAVFSGKLLYMPIRQGERPVFSPAVHQNPSWYSNHRTQIFYENLRTAILRIIIGAKDRI